MLTAPAEKWVVMITTVTADNSCWLSSTGGAKIRSWIQDTIPDVIIIPVRNIRDDNPPNKEEFLTAHVFYFYMMFFFWFFQQKKRCVDVQTPEGYYPVVVAGCDVTKYKCRDAALFSKCCDCYTKSTAMSESLHVWRRIWRISCKHLISDR